MSETDELPLCRRCGKNPVVLKDLVCSECVPILHAQVLNKAAETKAFQKDRSVRWKPGRLIQWAMFKGSPYSVRIQLFGWNFLLVICKQPK